jgi:hypothetical protein
MATQNISEGAWERMVRAVEKVRDRLRRTCEILEEAAIPYALIGGNAVAIWVAEIDEAAVRNTQDVDILIRRSDLEGVIQAFEARGFHYRYSSGNPMFLDGPEAKARDAVHIVFAKEKVRQDHLHPTPDVEPVSKKANRRVIGLEDLVRMKLTSFRLKDQVHIQDLASVGLVDSSWAARFDSMLSALLSEVLGKMDE